MTKNTQPALTIIEILVAVSLISMILTALSVNMIYTQRSIKNSQLRAKAVDQAESCLNQFRNLRDANPWTFFCGRVFDGGISGSTSNTLTFNLGQVCKIDPAAGLGDATFTFSHDDPAGRPDYNCKGAGGKAIVTITVNYSDFSGVDQHVTLSQEFAKASYEAQYL